MGSTFDAILGRFYDDGTELELGAGVDAKGGLTAARNEANRRIELTISPTVGLVSSATVYVTAGGNNATGVRGNPLFPYLTLEAAFAVVQSGDVVDVGVGTFAGGLALPDVAVCTVRGQGESTVITHTGGSVLYRTSATALTSLTVERCWIVNTGTSASGLFVDGSTADYALTSPGVVLREVRVTHDDPSRAAIAVRVCGYVYAEDVIVGEGITDIDECGVVELRDAASPQALNVDFTAGTLPDGFTDCQLHVYSGKFDDVTITGVVDATFDASCELTGDFAMTGDTGSSLRLNGYVDKTMTLTTVDSVDVRAMPAGTDTYSLAYSADDDRWMASAVVLMTGTGETMALGFYGATPVTQAVVIGQLTDSTGGSADGTLVAISGSGEDADINNNFADLAAKVNALELLMTTTGLTAT